MFAQDNDTVDMDDLNKKEIQENSEIEEDAVSEPNATLEDDDEFDDEVDDSDDDEEIDE
jgi:hypothetical protein